MRDTGPSIEAKGQPGNWRTKWAGVLTCGHIWTCPICSERLRRQRLERVLRAIAAAGGVWQMVTLTVRHRDGMPLRELIRGLMRAWRKAKQGGAMQRIWASRVTASVRGVEITRGAHGWHPHLHVLLRTEGLSAEEKQTLLERWLLFVEREMGTACVPRYVTKEGIEQTDRAIRWSNPINMCEASERDRARYLVKLGLELTHKKDGRRGSLSHWDIAKLAADGDALALDWWKEFYRATKGRRMVELDDRAAAFARVPLAPLAFGVNVAEPLDVAQEVHVSIPVDSLELRALRQYEARDPSILAVITADVSRSEDPRKVVRAWLDHIMRCLRYTVPDGRNQKEALAQGRARGHPEGHERAQDRGG